MPSSLHSAVIFVIIIRTISCYFQPYLCESFYVLLEYGRTAMFHWFLVEGLHLHNVLTINVFQGSYR
jgi:hypothetical protein